MRKHDKRVTANVEAMSELQSLAAERTISQQLRAGAKHKGRPMSEVVAEDPGYCQWVLQQAEACATAGGLGCYCSLAMLIQACTTRPVTR